MVRKTTNTGVDDVANEASNKDLKQDVEIVVVQVCKQ